MQAGQDAEYDLLLHVNMQAAGLHAHAVYSIHEPPAWNCGHAEH